MYLSNQCKKSNSLCLQKWTIWFGMTHISLYLLKWTLLHWMTLKFSLISFFFEFTFIFVWHWLGSQKYLLVFYGSTFLLRFTTFVHRWQHDPLICRYQMYLTCEFVPTKIEVLSGRKEVEVEEEWKFPNIMILARSKTAH